MKICQVCSLHFSETTCPHCQTTGAPMTVGGIALSVLLGVGLTACPSPQALYGAPPMDLDGDGFDDFDDCDDQDPYTYPGAAIEDSETACMTDFDGDGYGDSDPAEGVEPGNGL